MQFFRTYKRSITSVILAFFFFQQSLIFPAVASEISGVTGTNMSGGGQKFDIYTDHISGDTGFRHYNKFDLSTGDVANLNFQNASNTQNVNTFVNLVDNRININGILNTMQGGNFYNGRAVFISPNGMMVGATGVLNVGSLTAIAPTPQNYFTYLTQDAIVDVAETKLNDISNAIGLGANITIPHLYEISDLKLGDMATVLATADNAAFYGVSEGDVIPSIDIRGTIIARDSVEIVGKDIVLDGAKIAAGVGLNQVTTSGLSVDNTEVIKNRSAEVFNALVNNDVPSGKGFGVNGGKIIITGQSVKEPTTFGLTDKIQLKISNALQDFIFGDLFELIDGVYKVKDTVVGEAKTQAEAFLTQINVNEVNDARDPNALNNQNHASVVIKDSTLAATDVEIQARSLVNYVPPAIRPFDETYIGATILDPVSGTIQDAFVDTITDDSFINWEGSRAKASVDVYGNTTIKATGDIDITSDAIAYTVLKQSSLFPQTMVETGGELYYSLGSQAESSVTVGRADGSGNVQLINDGSYNGKERAYTDKGELILSSGNDFSSVYSKDNKDSGKVNISAYSENVLNAKIKNKSTVIGDALTGSLGIPSIQVAIVDSNLQADTTVNVYKDVTINAKNDVLVNAINQTSNIAHITTQAAVDESDTASPGAAVSLVFKDATVNTSAFFDGNVVTDGDFTVNAQNLYMSNSVITAEVSTGLSMLGSAAAKIGTKLMGKISDSAGGVIDLSSLPSASVALLVNNSDVSTSASIGNSANVEADNIKVNANTIDLTSNAVTAQLELEGKAGSGYIPSPSVAVLVNEQNNNTTAQVQDGTASTANNQANLSALGDIIISATTEVPKNQSTFEFALDLFQLIGNLDGLYDAAGNLKSGLTSFDIINGEWDFAALQQEFENAANNASDALEKIGDLKYDYKAAGLGTLGLQGLFNNWVQTKSDSQSGSALGASVLVTATNSNTNAYLGKYTKANSTGDLFVNAVNQITQFNSAGDMASITGLLGSTSGTSAGLGGNVVYETTKNKAEAKIGESAVVDASNVYVTSANDESYITFVITGSKATGSTGVAVSGSVIVQDLGGDYSTKEINGREYYESSDSADSDGLAYVDRNGNAITISSSGTVSSGVYVDTDGRYVNASGQYVDGSGNVLKQSTVAGAEGFYEYGTTTDGIFLNKDGALVNIDGNFVKANGQLVKENESPVYSHSNFRAYLDIDNMKDGDYGYSKATIASGAQITASNNVIVNAGRLITDSKGNAIEGSAFINTVPSQYEALEELFDDGIGSSAPDADEVTEDLFKRPFKTTKITNLGEVDPLTGMLDLDTKSYVTDGISNLLVSGALSRQSQDAASGSSSSSSSGAAIGASVNYTTFNKIVEATIEDGVTINAKKVDVISDTYTQSLNVALAGAFAGGVSTPGSIDKLKGKATAKIDGLKNSLTSKLNPFGSSSPNTTPDPNASVSNSNMPTQTGTQAGSGGTNISIGAAGSVNAQINNSSVKSEVKQGAIINVDNALNVIADQATKNLSIAGGVAKGNTVGMGAAVNYIENVNKTEAILSADVNFKSAGNLNVKANETNDNIQVAIGVGVATPKSGSSAGVALSGSVNFDKLENKVLASIINADIEREASDVNSIAINVDADNISTAYKGAGAMSVKTGQGNSVSLGVGANVNDIDKSTTAQIVDSNLKDVSSLNVTSNKGESLEDIKTEDIVSVAVGASVSASSGGGNSVGAAGSTNIDLINNSVLAQIYSSGSHTIDANGNINVLANNNIFNGSIAGAVRFTTSKSFGAGIGAIVSIIENEVIAKIEGYDSIGASDSKAGAIKVASNIKEDLKLLAINLGVDVQASGSVNLGLSGIVNIIENTQEASILNVDNIYSSSNVAINSNYDNDIFAISGIGGVSGNVFVANALVNYLNSQNIAKVSNSSVSADGKLSVVANSNEEIVSFPVAAAISAGSGVAANINVSTNIIQNTTKATIESTSAKNINAGAIDVKANDDTTITTRGGNASVSGSGVVAGAMAYADVVNKTVDAHIEGVGLNIASIDDINVVAGAINLMGGELTRDASGNLTYSPINVKGLASSGTTGISDFASWTMAYSVNGTTGSAALNGNVLYKTATNNINAHIGSGVTISDANNINVLANNTLVSKSIVGSAGGASSAAIGGNAIANVNESIVNAEIKDGVVIGSELNKVLDVKVDANSEQVHQSIVAIGQGAGSAGIAGAVNVNVIDNQTSSKIGKGVSIYSQGDVSVLANDLMHLESFDVALGAAGSAAISPVVYTNIFTNTVSALMGSTGTRSNIFANDISVVANNEQTFLANVIAAGFAGSAAITSVVVVNLFDSTVEAGIENTNIVSTGDINVKASSGFNKDEVVNLPDIVQEDSADKLEYNDNAISNMLPLVGVIGISASGSASVNANVITNIINTTVDAYVKNSDISANSLKVDADSAMTTYDAAITFAASAAAAIGAMGVANVYDGHTIALVENTDIENASVAVSADDKFNLNSVIFSVGATGTAAIGAITNVNIVENNVLAKISGGSITNGGAISATSSNDLNIHDMLIIGNGAGVGAAVSASPVVNLINNSLESLVENTPIDADSLKVEAKNTQDFDNFVVALSAVIEGAGVGASVIVNVVENTVKASVNSGANDITLTGDLDVIASDNIVMTNILGSVGIGIIGAGVGANVNVNNIDNTVAALLQAGSANTVNAKSADVSSDSTIAMDNSAYVASGGAGAINAGVIITQIGGDIESFDSNSDLEKVKFDDGSGSEYGLDGLLSNASEYSVVNSDLSTTTRSFDLDSKTNLGTSARIAANVNTTGADGVNVSANNLLKGASDDTFDTKNYSAGIGIGTIGASVLITDLDYNTMASISNSLINTNGGNIDVVAKSTAKSNIDAMGATISGIDLNANVALFTSDSLTRSSVSSSTLNAKNSSNNSRGDVTISADSSETVSTNALSASIDVGTIDVIVSKIESNSNSDALVSGALSVTADDFNVVSKISRDIQSTSKFYGITGLTIAARICDTILNADSNAIIDTNAYAGVVDLTGVLNIYSGTNGGSDIIVKNTVTNASGAIIEGAGNDLTAHSDVNFNAGVRGTKGISGKAGSVSVQSGTQNGSEINVLGILKNDGGSAFEIDLSYISAENIGVSNAYLQNSTLTLSGASRAATVSSVLNRNADVSVSGVNVSLTVNAANAALEALVGRNDNNVLVDTTGSSISSDSGDILVEAKANSKSTINSKGVTVGIVASGSGKYYDAITNTDAVVKLGSFSTDDGEIHLDVYNNQYSTINAGSTDASLLVNATVLNMNSQTTGDSSILADDNSLLKADKIESIIQSVADAKNYAGGIDSGAGLINVLTLDYKTIADVTTSLVLNDMNADVIALSNSSVKNALNDNSSLAVGVLVNVDTLDMLAETKGATKVETKGTIKNHNNDGQADSLIIYSQDSSESENTTVSNGGGAIAVGVLDLDANVSSYIDNLIDGDIHAKNITIKSYMNKDAYSSMKSSQGGIIQVANIDINATSTNGLTTKIAANIESDGLIDIDTFMNNNLDVRIDTDLGGLLSINTIDVNSVVGTTVVNNLTFGGASTRRSIVANKIDAHALTNTEVHLSKDGSSGGFIVFDSGELNNTIQSKATLDLRSVDIDATGDVDLTVRNAASSPEKIRVDDDADGFAVVVASAVQNTIDLETRVNSTDANINAKDITLNIDTGVHRLAEYKNNAYTNINNISDLNVATLDNNRFTINKSDDAVGLHQEVVYEADGFITDQDPTSNVTANIKNYVNINSGKWRAADELAINMNSSNIISTIVLGEGRSFASDADVRSELRLNVNNYLNVGNKSGSGYDAILSAGDKVDINFMGRSYQRLLQEASLVVDSGVPLGSSEGGIFFNTNNNLTVLSDGLVEADREIYVTYDRGVEDLTSRIKWNRTWRLLFGIPIRDTGSRSSVSVTNDNALHVDGKMVVGANRIKTMIIDKDGNISQSGFESGEYHDGDVRTDGADEGPTMYSDLSYIAEEIQALQDEIAELQEVYGKNSAEYLAAKSKYNTLISEYANAINILDNYENLDTVSLSKVEKEIDNAINSGLNSGQKGILDTYQHYLDSGHYQTFKLSLILAKYDTGKVDDDNNPIMAYYFPDSAAVDSIINNYKSFKSESNFQNISFSANGVNYQLTTYNGKLVVDDNANKSTDWKAVLDNFRDQKTIAQDQLDILNKAYDVTDQVADLNAEIAELKAKQTELNYTDLSYSDITGEYIVFDDIVIEPARMVFAGITPERVTGSSSGVLEVATAKQVNITNYSDKSLVFNDIKISQDGDDGLFFSSNLHISDLDKINDNAHFQSTVWGKNATKAAESPASSTIINDIVYNTNNKDIHGNVITEFDVIINTYYDHRLANIADVINKNSNMVDGDLSHILVFGTIDNESNEIELFNDSGNIDLRNDLISKSKKLEAAQGSFLSKSSRFDMASGDHLIAGQDIRITAGTIDNKGVMRAGLSDRDLTLTGAYAINASTGTSTMATEGTYKSVYSNTNNNIKAVTVGSETHLLNSEATMGNVILSSNNITSNATSSHATGYGDVSITNSSNYGLVIHDFVNNYEKTNGYHTNTGSSIANFVVNSVGTNRDVTLKGILSTGNNGSGSTGAGSLVLNAQSLTVDGFGILAPTNVIDTTGSVDIDTVNGFNLLVNNVLNNRKGNTYINNTSTGGVNIVGDIKNALGNVSINNAGTQGISVEGNILNDRGNTDISSAASGGITIRGLVDNNNGYTSIVNTAGSSGGITISGIVKNNEDARGNTGNLEIKNEGNGDIEIASTADIFNYGTSNLIISSTSASNNGGINAALDSEIKNITSGNITIDNASQGGITLAGLVDNNKGNTTILNSGTSKISISGTVENNSGSLTVDNTSVANNSGIELKSTGRLNNTGGNINITNVGKFGIDVDGLIKAVNHDISIINSDSHITIGDNTVGNDNYIQAQAGKIIINQTNGNILNGIIDSSPSELNQNHDLGNVDPDYKTLLKSKGDINIDITNGDVGVYAQNNTSDPKTDREFLPEGFGIDAQTRDYLESINVNIASGSKLNVTATSADANGSLVNIRAKNSALSVDVVSDGDVMLTAADWKQADNPSAHNPASNDSYYNGYSIVGKAVGDNISLIASDKIGSNSNSKFVYKNNDDGWLSVLSENNIYIEGQKNAQGTYDKSNIWQLITKRGSLDLTLGSNEDLIVNLIAGTHVYLNSVGEKLTIINLGVKDGSNLDFNDILYPHDGIKLGENGGGMPETVAINVFDAFPRDKDGDGIASDDGYSTLDIYNAYVKGYNKNSNLAIQNREGLHAVVDPNGIVTYSEISLMADEVIATSAEAAKSNIVTTKNPSGYTNPGRHYKIVEDSTAGRIVHLGLEETDALAPDAADGFTTYGDGDMLSFSVMGVVEKLVGSTSRADTIAGIVPSYTRDNFNYFEQIKTLEFFNNQHKFSDNGYMADYVRLSLNSNEYAKDMFDSDGYNRGMLINTLFANDSYVDTKDLNMTIHDSVTKNYGEFRNGNRGGQGSYGPNGTYRWLVAVDNNGRRYIDEVSGQDVTAQYYTELTGSLSLILNNYIKIISRSPAVHYNPYEVYVTALNENSFFRLTYKDDKIQKTTTTPEFDDVKKDTHTNTTRDSIRFNVEQPKQDGIVKASNRSEQDSMLVVKSIIDISRGGMKLETEGDVKVGDTFFMNLALEDISARVELEVRRVGDNGVIGVKFLDLDESLANKIMYMQMFAEKQNDKTISKK